MANIRNFSFSVHIPDTLINRMSQDSQDQLLESLDTPLLAAAEDALEAMRESLKSKTFGLRLTIVGIDADLNETIENLR